MVAIWDMYSLWVLTTGSFGSRPPLPSTTGKSQSSVSRVMMPVATLVATIDQLAVVVVGELDVLRGAEGLQQP